MRAMKLIISRYFIDSILCESDYEKNKIKKIIKEKCGFLSRFVCLAISVFGAFGELVREFLTATVNRAKKKMISVLFSN